MKLTYRCHKSIGKARAGEFTLNGITVQTPVFMPVGTKATIKGLILDLLKDPRYFTNPSNIILANTFHLYLNPGHERIQQAGGLHTFEGRENGLILTDSGGFQVFSLGKSGFSKITDEGIIFKSPYDGSTHTFSPEKVVDIQRSLGSDIMMVLDICSDLEKNTKDSVAKDMKKTHDWAKRQFEYFEGLYDSTRGVLFPIIQGGIYKDLREESVSFLRHYARDGIAIGGLSVGETVDEMRETLEFLYPFLPTHVPRYLMGIGTPEYISIAIENGIDMFDCVLPTRLGRHGVAFSPQGTIKILNSKYKNDFSPLDETSPALQKYTKAYLHHLFKQNEMLGPILLSIHNINYLSEYTNRERQKILTS